MTEATVQSPIEEALGTEFWTQPAESLSETFNFLYAQALAPLRDVVRERSGSVLDYMLVERLAFSYAILRQREADPDNPIADRTRREMNKDWLEFTLTLKKLWFTEDKNNQAEDLVKKLDKAVWSALKDMPEDQAKVIQSTMADIFEAAGM